MTFEFATLTTDDLVTGEAVALESAGGQSGRPHRVGADRRGRDDDPVRRGDLRLRGGRAAGRRRADLGVVHRDADRGLPGLPVHVETLTRGKSLGRLVCGLRTVRDDAGPITFQHAFVRALIGFVEIYVFTGVPAFFSALMVRAASGWATTPPGPTSSATGSAFGCPRRR